MREVFLKINLVKSQWYEVESLSDSVPSHNRSYHETLSERSSRLHTSVSLLRTWVLRAPHKLRDAAGISNFKLFERNRS